ncbi:hypothetical protein SAMN05660226_02338 [Parapedobacter luteus]|uniref:Uncharacterized protein n=1 Tax=Parapedobacter luteus TaxID=623280 RepID=A0A1T5CU25_9SPHI|nr:hypothetical protein [Parapedobacter luteus]SKB62846.1 hypothetical protein SAMN05660226_02338 [Parapedobacter luteus]
MKEAKDVSFIILGGIAVAAIWSVTAIYFEYAAHSYIETILSEPDTGWYYVDTPVDCPPCKARHTRYSARLNRITPYEYT